jgi:hypothetical protein
MRNDPKTQDYLARRRAEGKSDPRNPTQHQAIRHPPAHWCTLTTAMNPNTATSST